MLEMPRNPPRCVAIAIANLNDSCHPDLLITQALGEGADRDVPGRPEAMAYVLMGVLRRIALNTQLAVDMRHDLP